jgi:hypothetical protein
MFGKKIMAAALVVALLFGASGSIGMTPTTNFFAGTCCLAKSKSKTLKRYGAVKSLDEFEKLLRENEAVAVAFYDSQNAAKFRWMLLRADMDRAMERISADIGDDFDSIDGDIKVAGVNITKVPEIGGKYSGHSGYLKLYVDGVEVYENQISAVIG